MGPEPKFVDATAQFIKDQMSAPSDEFARLVGRNIYEGSITKAVLEEMKAAVTAGMEQVIREHIQDKLNIAFKKEPSAEPSAITASKPEIADDGIETTADEIQAFMIVRALCGRKIPVSRITLRDAKSYCCVYVDDNNRKPVCRFYFNAKKGRSIGIFDASKTETKFAISELDDIYDFSAQLEDAVSPYVTDA